MQAGPFDDKGQNSRGQATGYQRDGRDADFRPTAGIAGMKVGRTVASNVLQTGELV